jgi:hypothetical protein
MDRKQLAALLDRSALRDLALRYARAIDRRDRDLLLSCYHPDAIDHHGNVFRGSPLEYADWQPQIMAQFSVTAHYIVNTDYRIDGDRAEGELYFIAYHRTSPPDSKEVIVGGRYHDRYERRNGEWRIAYRTIAWDFANSNPLDEKSFAFLKSLGNLGSGADDASFSSLPMFAKGTG